MKKINAIISLASWEPRFILGIEKIFDEYQVPETLIIFCMALLQWLYFIRIFHCPHDLPVFFNFPTMQEQPLNNKTRNSTRQISDILFFRPFH